MKQGDPLFLTAAGLGLALVGVFASLDGHPLAQELIYVFAGLGFFGLLIFGLTRNVHDPSWVWRLLFAGVACELAGDIVAGSPSVPSPSWFADGLYLAGFPFFIVGLIASMRPRRLVRESVLAQLLDSAIVFASGFGLLFFVWLDGSFDSSVGSLSQRVLVVAYPLLDWVVLALLLRFVFTPGQWPPALRLLVLAGGLMFIADLASPIGHRVGTTGQLWIGVAALLSYLCWALAGLHPSVAQIEGFHPDADRAPVLHRRRVVLLLLCALVPGALLLASRGRNDVSTEDVAMLLLAVAGVPILTVARLADIFRQLHRTVTEAEEARADLEAVIEASPVPICVTDTDASVLIWNDAAAKVSGYAAGEVLGNPPPIVPAEEPERIANLYKAALEGEVQRGIEIKLIDRDENPLDIRFSTAPLAGGRRGVVVLFEDVTRERQTAAQLEFLANHDPLTRLPNRRAFARELEQAVARSSRGEHATLLLCDIDNFKFVNDSAGHPVGDRFLIEVANRLRTRLRPGDTLARLSGDEFAIVLGGATEAEAAPAVERLLKDIRDYRLESHSGVLDITLSAGVYELREGETVERALRRADDALYEAKEHGKNQHRVWNADNVAVLSASRGWSPRLKDALRDDRIDAFLQPIVSLPGEELVFHEMLCRLRRSDGSYILPGAFLDHADRLGLMPAIDRRMLEHAATLLAQHPDLRLLVNLSAASFDDEGLLAYLHTILEAMQPGSLGVEITERAALSDLSRATTELHTLKRLGALVAIDDFGQGFTSFEHLRRLPADLVKIGNGFIEGLGTDPFDEAILDGIVSTSRALSMRVVAEGVETRETARLLQLRDIAYAQGYLYGRPAPIDEALQAVAHETVDDSQLPPIAPAAQHLRPHPRTADARVQ